MNENFSRWKKTHFIIYLVIMVLVFMILINQYLDYSYYKKQPVDKVDAYFIQEGPKEVGVIFFILLLGLTYGYLMNKLLKKIENNELPKSLIPVFKFYVGVLICLFAFYFIKTLTTPVSNSGFVNIPNKSAQELLRNYDNK